MPAEKTPKTRKKKPSYNKEERIEMNLHGIDTAWPNHKSGKYDGLVESTQRHIAFMARKGVPEDTVTRALNYYALQRLVKLNVDIRLRGRHNSTPFPANADSEKVKRDVKNWLSPRRDGHTALNFPAPNNGKLDPAQMTAIKVDFDPLTDWLSFQCFDENNPPTQKAARGSAHPACPADLARRARAQEGR